MNDERARRARRRALRRAILAAGAGVCAASGAASASGTSPFGLWARDDGVAQVRIERCGAALCAINTWIRPGVKDERTGDRLVLTVTPTGPASWTGSAFDPQRDRTYAFRMKVGDRRMTTRGCILAGLLCKDVGWTRLAASR